MVQINKAMLFNKVAFTTTFLVLALGSGSFTPSASAWSFMGGSTTRLSPSFSTITDNKAGNSELPSINKTTQATERREWMKQAAMVVVGGTSVLGGYPVLASADDEENAPAVSSSTAPEITPKVNRMGGLLEKFQDGPRGFRMFAPSGWNKFDGEVGAYDVMWRDLVDIRENVKVSSTPVKSTTTSVAVLGDVQKLGESLAVKRNAKLVKASERITEGILFYTFEFAINDGTHQLLQLCVNKGKIWSLTCSASEKRWSKQAELYENVANSFYPTIV